MTTYEMIGMRKQYASKTIEEATKNLHVSCEGCVMHGWKNCKFCPIQQAHDVVVSNIESIEYEKEIEEKLLKTKKRLGLA